MSARTLALVDGEHYPPVVRAALEHAGLEDEVVAALLVGGHEKLSGEPDYGVPLERLDPDGFRRRVASFAEANHLPVVTLKAADRNIEVMKPYLDKAAVSGRSQVAAIGVAQEMQRGCSSPGSGIPIRAGARSSPLTRKTAGSPCTTSNAPRGALSYP